MPGIPSWGDLALAVRALPDRAAMAANLHALGVDEDDMGQEPTDRWQERPLLGAVLQACLTLTPLLVGIAVGIAVSRWVLPGRIDSTLAAWAVSGAAAMATVYLLQPVMRRIVPLAWLLKLGMLWPGRAPSRYKVARRAGQVRDLEERLARAREYGLEGDAEHAAELILSLTAALTAHDRKTRGHAERVRVFTDMLSVELGLSREERDRLRWSSLLHDIGKLDVPETILNKPGKPSPREWELLRSHPEAGDRIMAPLRDWLGEWADATLHHHERFDGKGYPAGLAGQQISRAGRIVAVADAYEVMTATRAYKRPMSAAAARDELASCSGEQFDPAIVRAFLLVPIWRLRWAMGPFGWVVQLPLARDLVHAGSTAGALAPAAGAAAGTTAVLVGSGLTLGNGAVVLPDDVGTAAHGEIAEVEAARVARVSSDETASGDDPQIGAGSDGLAVPRDTLVREPTDDGREADDEPTTSDETPPVPSEPTSGSEPGQDAEDSTDEAQTAEDLVDDTTDTVEEVVDDLTDTVEDVVDDTTDTVEKVVDDTTEAVDDVLEDPVGSLDGTIDDTTDTVEEVADDSTDTVEDVVDDTTRAVEDTIGGVLGGG